MKTGIEVVDEKPRLSCVVTNGYSDWSTQAWPESKVRIRVIIKGDSSFVVEAAPFDNGEFNFIRIAHLHKDVNHVNDPLAAVNTVMPENTPPSRRQCYQQGDCPGNDNLWAGVFGCCPENNQGCSIQFHEFLITRGTKFEHNADGNQ